jgi:demethoxyubiquinone hydroxylase (CLK1/Coq7/Cat5 family)
MNQTNQVVDKLNEFLRGEMSAVETYRQALEKIESGGTRTQLEQCRRSHEERVNLLQRSITNVGGQPTATSGAWGSFAKLAEGGAKVFGEKAAIAALEEGEDHGLKLYRKDLEKLDASAQELVRTDLLPAQERTHRALSDLKHGLH